MLTAETTSKINTMMVSIKTQKNFLTRKNEAEAKELVGAQDAGEVQRATTISTEIEKRNVNVIILDKINALLEAYLKDGSRQALLDGNNQILKEHSDFSAKWSISSSLFSLFKSDPMADLFANFKSFVATETKPLIDAQRAEKARNDAELRAYFQTSQGKEMASTLSFIMRG